ncbi:MAG: T9SS type A sorting domain-containing protein [Chitinophagales bacterium]|nr:T9SS type A sorting domain-containing protein [Chitinophagales bacterium]
MKKYVLLLFSFFLLQAINAQSLDCSNGRYQKKIFSFVKRTNNIVYATKYQSNNQKIYLKYDVYEPIGDTAQSRAVMLLIHGGAYLKLIDQNSPDIVLMADYFAKLGYVAVSIDYRQEPDILGLLNEEVMVKAVSRALIDTKDAIDHFVATYENGNPFRINIDNAYIGGVSAGGVSTMFICYLDSLQQMPEQYQQWIIEANGPEADSILRHKFDHVKPKGAFSVSGAILDTSWIVDNGIDLLVNHGSADPIVPYNYDRPFGIPTLPKLFGGKAIYPRAINQGIRCEFEDWIGYSHVPFMNLTLPKMITNFINFPVLDSTERHIRDFFYPTLDCQSNIVSGIHQNKVADLKIYPNPSTDVFYIDIPNTYLSQSAQLEIFSINGQKVYEQIIPNNQSKIAINKNLPAGLYPIRLSYMVGNELNYYNNTIIRVD